MNRENKQDNIRKNEHKRLNKTKVIKISLSLFVVIIFVILFVVSLQVIKTTKIGAKVLDNLSGDTTEDVWQIISVSDEEETEENAGEVEDERVTDDESETSETSGTTENENTDDGISAIADSSDYTITITEYTGDTLEAEYTYESGSLILYVIDAETLQLFEVWQISETGDYPFSDYYSSWEESLSPGYKIATSPLFASYYYEYGPNSNTTLYKTTSELEFLTSDIYGFSVAYGCGRSLWEWDVRLSRNWRMELLLRNLLHHKLLA